MSDFLPLNVALLTISDTRGLEDDKSGNLLAGRITDAGHKLADRQIVKDDIYRMRAVFSQWIADSEVEVIVTTGGTGVTGRDSTPEAVAPLLDKVIEGFGELFRQLSYEEIGPSTIQSRAVAGMANSTLVFCLPGSSGACKTAWDKILGSQLDRRTKPCNFALLAPRFSET